MPEHRSRLFAGIHLAAKAALCRFRSICRAGGIVVICIGAKAVMIGIYTSIFPSAVIAYRKSRAGGYPARMIMLPNVDIFIIFHRLHRIGIEIHSCAIGRARSFREMHGGGAVAARIIHL